MKFLIPKKFICQKFIANLTLNSEALEIFVKSQKWIRTSTIIASIQHCIGASFQSSFHKEKKNEMKKKKK